jgi:hypothetical protein
MLVQSHCQFDVVADFDPDTGQLDVMARPEALPLKNTEGWFAQLADVRVISSRMRSAPS